MKARIREIQQNTMKILWIMSTMLLVISNRSYSWTKSTTRSQCARSRPPRNRGRPRRRASGKSEKNSPKRNEKKSWTPSSGNEKKKTNLKCRLKRKRSRKLSSKKKNAMSESKSENLNAKRCWQIGKRPKLNRRLKSNSNLFIIFLINFLIENSSTFELLWN